MRWHYGAARKSEYVRNSRVLSVVSYVMATYIRVQHARLLGRRLDIRNRRLKDVVFVKPSIQSLGQSKKKSQHCFPYFVTLARTWSKAFPRDCRCRIGELPLPMLLL
jgi:hypothetical protein